MSSRKLQNLFRSHLNYLDSTPQPLKNRKAISAIAFCRTPDMGTSYFTCDKQHKPIEQFHACRNRSCYLCALKSKQDWIEKQKSRLLNVPHFHVIFTLPHDYLPLWRYNQALFASFLFRASKETLLELMADSQYHGVLPGLMMVLHSWGRQLTLHPHTHCLITAGGVNTANQWQESKPFLLPIHVVKSLYRGKMQAFLKQAMAQKILVLPPDMTPDDFYRVYQLTFKKAWCVRIENRYDHGAGVMLYLSRYIKGGPVSPEQITFDGAQQVVLRYLDHRDSRVKTLKLSCKVLLKRILEHVPPIGFHTVRHYGLYAASCCKRNLRSVKEIGTLLHTQLGAGENLRNMLLSCKTCGGAVHLVHRSWKKRSKAFSINRETSEIPFVQQGDQGEFAGVPIGKIGAFSSA